MTNFITRLFQQVKGKGRPASLEYDSYPFPNLCLGISKKSEEVNQPIKIYLPNIRTKRARQNQVIFANVPSEAETRLLRKFIKQDIKYQEYFHSNYYLLTHKQEWNNKTGFQTNFISGVTVISPDHSMTMQTYRDSIEAGVPERDVHIFNPTKKGTPILDVMSLPTNEIVDFLAGLFKDKSSLRHDWLTYLVGLEKAYAELDNRSPNFTDLLEFFRNPASIMDIYHYVEDNLDKINKSKYQKVIDDLKNHFHLGDAKQNDVNFEIYDVLFHYQDESKLGRYLFNENINLIELSSIIRHGGICIFELASSELGIKDAKLWSNLISMALQSTLTKRRSGEATQLPIYLCNFDNYLSDSWINLIKSATNYNSNITLNIASLDQMKDPDSIDHLLHYFPVRTIYGDMKPVSDDFVRKYVKYFITNDQFDIKSLRRIITTLPINTAFTRLNNDEFCLIHPVNQ